MPAFVTACAERDEIFFSIIPQPTAGADVVDLKILRRAAVLAVPPVAREHRAGELAVRLRFKPQSRRLPFGSFQGRFSQCPATAFFVPREARHEPGERQK
jgi:hypothetical protein